ncbi:GntR family transcriptional regulator [Edaphobacter sp. 12200R-103]|uniref:GntR family transcriptional regulator n=1 Tax=Edaphobacter sp. 12200R-103 TaxID=2703788 RepID=UPI00138C6106|nr:GntR family transcriptional regulator [Edaphobacter sp. 12200R-103]QHS52065.1 GntR family transcriptional regulator [Edaphobacter sp. 12200R-103]
MKAKTKSKSSKSNYTIREKAYQYIQSRIASGNLPSGGAISELLLAKELGSSRTPVREAISQLVSEGLLEQTPNRGTIVVRLTREDIVDLYELREALEVYVVAKVTREQLPAEDLKRLEQLSDGILSLVDELHATGESYLNAEQMQRFIAADRGFHTLLMAFSFNPRIRKIVDETRLLIRIFAMRRVGYDTEKLRDIHAQHAAILAAIVSKDPELAMRRLAEHIQISRQERLDEFDRNRRASTIERSYLDLNL